MLIVRAVTVLVLMLFSCLICKLRNSRVKNKRSNDINQMFDLQTILPICPCSVFIFFIKLFVIFHVVEAFISIAIYLIA